MAERRMYTKKITDSDAFIKMSSAAQALYFHLNQGADDDGFNNQITNAMFKAHASTDALKILLAKRFVIQFESGVIVIKHWRMHNTLRKDRYTPTSFQEEIQQLGIKDDGSYTFGCQVVAERLPQVSIGKNSIGKEKENTNINISTKEKVKRFVKPTIEEIENYCNERQNGIDATHFFNHYEAKGWLIGKTPMKDWKAAVRTWERKSNDNDPKEKETVVSKDNKDNNEQTSSKQLERQYQEYISLGFTIEDMKGVPDLYEYAKSRC